MDELKTQRTDADVETFLDSVADERRREDARIVCRLLRDVTGTEPMMWGASMVGFGSYSYTYASGRSGEWFAIGFAPRKQALTIYVMDGFAAYQELLGRLGKHTTGKSCLYVKRLDDIDLDVLRAIIADSWSQPRPGQDAPARNWETSSRRSSPTTPR